MSLELRVRRVASERSGGGDVQQKTFFFFSANGPATDIVVTLSTLANLIVASGSSQLCCPVRDGNPTEALLRGSELLGGASW